MLKIGRNSPCWCGSGNKYKKCHLGKDKVEPHTIQTALKEIKRVFAQKYCLHPEASTINCKKNIVKAHSISKIYLKNIARNGKVYHFRINMGNIIRQEGHRIASLVGIHHGASTFTGFCAHHDNQAFEPIEKRAFENALEQNFLLSYRALCRELFAKIAQKEMIPFQKEADKGKALKDQIDIQIYNNIYEAYVESGFRELSRHKAIYDKCFVERDYDNINYFVLKMAKKPDILCSGAIYPEFDFEGNELQNMDDIFNRKDLICFNIIATVSHGFIIFLWHRDSNQSCIKLMKSLIKNKKENQTDAIIRFAFEYLENVFITPLWWEGLNTKQQDSIERRVANVSNHNQNCLVPDKHFYADWKPISFDTNVPKLQQANY